MNQIFARRLINFLLGNDVFRLGQIFIASSDCFLHFADLCPHVALSGSVVHPTLIVLPKSFLGAGCIWHDFKENAFNASKWGFGDISILWAA